MKGRGRLLVAALSLLAAGAWGGYLFVRSELGLGSRWTDGRRDFGLYSDRGIRYAVWDDPRPLPLALDEDLRASRPTLSPDGRLLVFAVGERGLNADLWVAERRGEGFGKPRPLTEVNSPADELAPAFGADGLYFASDRSGPAYGLDLWRAPLDELGFAEPEPLGAGLNTRADETDPCPLPGGRALAFASDRERGTRRDFDLYVALPEGAGDDAFAVEPLEALNTPFDEREPATSADGLALYFASDRAGSRGGFDLFRSFREDARWLAPEPLTALNTERSERSPSPSADGFSLLYEEADDDAAEAPPAFAPAGFLRARSLELFRTPPPPLSWQELLLLASLLLLAALAVLAGRWKTLDVVYRCFLASLLAHLLVLWYLRRVYPESEPFATRGPDRTFQVHLAASPAGTPASLRERSGELDAAPAEASLPAEPARRSEGTELAAARPEQRALERPSRAETLPERGAAHLEERRAEAAPADPRLADRDAPVERLAAAAPALVLSAAPTAARAVEAPAAEPTRGRAAEPEARSFRPHDAALVATARGADAREVLPDALPLPAPAPADRGRAARLGEPSVAAPAERFEALAGGAPDLSLPDVVTTPAPERGSSEAVRRDAAPVRPREAAAPGELARLESRPRPEPEAPLFSPLAGPEPELVLPRTDTRAPAPDEVAVAAALAPALPLPEPGKVELPTRPIERPRRDAPRLPERRPAEAPAPVALAPPEVALSEREPERLPERVPERLERARPESPAAVETRAPEEEEVRVAVPEPAPYDPRLDRLPAPERERPARERVAPPARLSSSTALADVAPEARPLAAAAPPAVTVDATPRSRRLEATPYKNRFGEEKLRALEEFGGSVETERAVALGLAYLASIQNENGSWGSKEDFHEKYGDVRVGKSALALLAFLGAGHTPGAPTEHGEAAARAVRFLLRQQDERSGHFGNSSAYSHGVATYALAECYALTQAAELRGPLERAVAHVLERQNDRRDPRLFGGWGYYYRDGRVWDGDTWPRVSVTAWQVMALESARLGGLEVPDQAFLDAREFLVNAWDSRRGAFRYSHDPGRLGSAYPILPASTPAALFGLSLLGIDVSAPELAPARDFVLRRAPRDYRYAGDDAFVQDARGNLYFWYYGTLAMFRAGGSSWSRWNASMKDTLLDAQTGDGSWVPISIYAGYAGDDDRDRSYSTALCVLTLEVYYRYFTPLLEVR